MYWIKTLVALAVMALIPSTSDAAAKTCRLGYVDGGWLASHATPASRASAFWKWSNVWFEQNQTTNGRKLWTSGGGITTTGTCIISNLGKYTERNTYIVGDGETLTISGDITVGNLIVLEGGELNMAPGSKLTLNRRISSATDTPGDGVDFAQLGLLYIQGGKFNAKGAVVYNGEITSVLYRDYDTDKDADGILVTLDPVPTDLTAGMYLRILDEDPESLNATLSDPVQIGEGSREKGKARSSYAKWRQYYVWKVDGSAVTLAYNQFENVDGGTHTQGVAAGTTTATPCQTGATDVPSLALGSTDSGTFGIAFTGAGGTSGEPCVGSYIGQRGMGHTTSASPESTKKTWFVGQYGMYSYIDIDTNLYHDNDLGRHYVHWLAGDCSGRHAKVVGVQQDEDDSTDDRIYISGDATECNGENWELTDGLRAGDKVAGVNVVTISGNPLTSITGLTFGTDGSNRVTHEAVRDTTSTTLTGITDTGDIADGDLVAGAGIVVGTTVSDVPTSTTVLLDQAPSGNGTSDLTFDSGDGYIGLATDANAPGNSGRVIIDHKLATVNLEHVVFRLLDSTNVCGGQVGSNCTNEIPLSTDTGDGQWTFDGINTTSDDLTCVICLINSDPSVGNTASSSSYKWIDIGFTHLNSVGDKAISVMFGLMQEKNNTADEWNITSRWDATGMELEYFYIHDPIVASGTTAAQRGWNPNGVNGGTLKRSRIERTGGPGYSSWNLKANRVNTDGDAVDCPTCTGTRHKDFHIINMEMLSESNDNRNPSAGSGTSAACIITYDYDASAIYNYSTDPSAGDSLNTGSGVSDFFGFGCGSHGAYLGTLGGDFRNIVVGGPTDFSFQRGIHRTSFFDANPNRVYNSVAYIISPVRTPIGSQALTYGSTGGIGANVFDSVLIGSPGPECGSKPCSEGMNVGMSAQFKRNFTVNLKAPLWYPSSNTYPTASANPSSVILTDNVFHQKDADGGSIATSPGYDNGTRYMEFNRNYWLTYGGNTILGSHGLSYYYEQCTSGCTISGMSSDAGGTVITTDSTNPFVDGQIITFKAIASPNDTLLNFNTAYDASGATGPPNADYRQQFFEVSDRDASGFKIKYTTGASAGDYVVLAGTYVGAVDTIWPSYPPLDPLVLWIKNSTITKEDFGNEKSFWADKPSDGPSDAGSRITNTYISVGGNSLEVGRNKGVGPKWTLASGSKHVKGLGITRSNVSARLRDFLQTPDASGMGASKPKSLGLSAMAVSHAMLGDLFVDQWENFSSSNYVRHGSGSSSERSGW